MLKHIATDVASASMSLGSSMPPAAVTKVAMQDKANATDYSSLSLIAGSLYIS